MALWILCLVAVLEIAYYLAVAPALDARRQRRWVRIAEEPHPHG